MNDTLYVIKINKIAEARTEGASVYFKWMPVESVFIVWQWTWKWLTSTQPEW